jgi:hypothetical protein
MFKNILAYVWKLPLCATAFFAGTALGGMAASSLGLPAPEIPVGADQAVMGQYLLITSLILAAGLAALAPKLAGRFIPRWLTLSVLIWVAYGVNNILEGAVFTSMSAASLFTVVLYFFASFLCGLAAAWLFPPLDREARFTDLVKRFFARYPVTAWIWRTLAAWLAFPLIYLAFGRLIAPLVLDYYEQGLFGLSLPGWEQILPLVAVRSLFFLIACLPVLVLWNASPRRLFWVLGLNLFLLVGGLNMLQAYWMPANLRIIHSLEILADELVYSGALILLLARSNEGNK